MADAHDTDPGCRWNSDCGGLDGDTSRAGTGAWVGASLSRPGRHRIPHDPDETFRGPSWAHNFCNFARNSAVRIFRGAGTRSRRSGHVHRRCYPGRNGAYDRWSSGDPSESPARTHPGSRRAGRFLDSTADSFQRRRIGPSGRGDGAAGSHRRYFALGSPGFRRPGPADGRMVGPRAPRARATGKS